MAGGSGQCDNIYFTSFDSGTCISILFIPTTMNQQMLRLLRILLAAYIVLMCGVFLVRGRLFVDGVDLYFYACHGRDFANGYMPSQEFAYIYFPGVFRFWSAVFRLFSPTTLVVQNAVAGVLLVNGLLIGLITKRLSGRWFFFVVGLGLYFAVASRFEGLAGTSEPLATIPFLLGILVWVHCEPSFRRNMLFGLAIGTTVYIKQQAGLLSLGVIWCLVSPTGLSGERQLFRARATQFASIAATSAVVLLTLILLEGHGFLPLWKGLSMAAGYKQEGNLFANLYSIFRNDESLAILAALSVAGLVASAGQKPILSSAFRHVCGLLVLSAVATLLQFRTRGYYHYILLLLPSLIIASLWACHAACERFPGDHWRDRTVKGVLILGIAAVFGHVGQRDFALNLFSLECFREKSEHVQPWHQRDVSRGSLAEARAMLPPGSQIVVLPPVRSVVYFQTDCVCPGGYAFGTIAELNRIRLDQTFAVVALKAPLGDRDAGDWETSKCDDFLRSVLSDSHFARTVKTERFVVYLQDE